MLIVRKENYISYCVYEHVFPDGSRYVGITKQDPKKRWSRGIGYRGQPVYEIIQKYNWDEIEHNIIASDLSLKDAQTLEKELVTKYNLRETGWNRTDGGDSVSIFEIDGQEMTSQELAEMSTANGISGHDITTRINHHGWSLERALSKDKVAKNTLYEYRGGWYTAKELAELSPIKGMTALNILTRLNKHKWTTERAVNQPLDVKIQPFGTGKRIFEYNGHMYNSYELLQLSPIKDELTTADITDRISHHGWDIETAITKPKRKRRKTQ